MVKISAAAGKSINTVEIHRIDLRYEPYRLRDRNREQALLRSILETGVQEPLRVVRLEDDCVILLDGFKRLRCGKKAGIGSFQFHVLAENEAMGIIQLIRSANAKSLHILEQARLVDDLKNVHRLSVREIAEKLERSVGWVAMRLGVFSEIPESIREKIFSGQFPAYCYIYTMRQFMRMKQIQRPEIEEFVGLVSNKGLSTREIDLLARGFFQGGQTIRDQIRTGDLQISLGELKKLGHPSTEQQSDRVHLNEFEGRLLRDLEILQKYMARAGRAVTDQRLTQAVHAEGNLLCGGILRVLPSFTSAIQGFYDRSQQA